MPANTGSPTVARTLLIAGVLVAPMYYLLQAAAAPFFPDFSWWATTASELGSDLSPVADAFNVGVIAQGALTLLAALGVGLALRRLGHRAVVAAAVALVVACNGVQTLWAGAFPMPDPRHGGHPAFIVGMLLLPPTCLWITWRHSRSRPLRGLAAVAVLWMLILVPMMSGAVALDTHGLRGALQRVFTLSVFPPILIACVVLRARLRAAPSRARFAASPLVVPLLVAAMGASSPSSAGTAAAPTEPSHAASPSLASLWRRTTPLATLVQAPHQSEHDFLLHAAAVIDAFTHTVAAEVCGVFERDDSTMRLVIVLMTQGSPAFCLHPRGRPSRDGGLAGLSIHSHVAPRAHPPAALVAELDALAGGKRPRQGQPMRFAGARFTMTDIAGGPGYLVHRGRLWHQRGLGTQRFVARVEAPHDSRVQTYLATTAGAVVGGTARLDDWRDDGWSITGGES